MAHFAELDSDNIVRRVLVVPDAVEAYGQQYLAETLGLGGTWVQTSYNRRMRFHFAGIGYRYDRVRNAFIPPSPYPSWVLDDKMNWTPPIPAPPQPAYWDEPTQAWVVDTKRPKIGEADHG